LSIAKKRDFFISQNNQLLELLKQHTTELRKQQNQKEHLQKQAKKLASEKEKLLLESVRFNN